MRAFGACVPNPIAAPHSAENFNIFRSYDRGCLRSGLSRSWRSAYGKDSQLVAGARNTPFLRLVERLIPNWRHSAKAIVLRRQRSHVRILSGAPLRQNCDLTVSHLLEIIVAEAQSNSVRFALRPKRGACRQGNRPKLCRHSCRCLSRHRHRCLAARASRLHEADRAELWLRVSSDLLFLRQVIFSASFARRSSTI
jgi:hypothetical protein